jgi:epoxide hydrolase-like predicted phosphatase
MGIDTIIFDFGGVLYKTPDMKKLLRWQKMLGIADDPEVTQLITDPSKSDLFWDVMLGKLTEDEMWSLLRTRWHIPPRIGNRFLKNVMSKRRLNKPLAKFLQTLRSRYKTAILSNAGDKTRGTMEKVFGLHALVDEIIISAEEGVAKPNHELYKIALIRLNSKAENCIFVDDLIENVNAAKAIGMNAILHVENDTTISSLNAMIRAER